MHRRPTVPYLDLSVCLRPVPTVAEVRLKVAVNLLISSFVLTYVMWLWGLHWLLYQTKLVKFQPFQSKMLIDSCTTISTHPSAPLPPLYVVPLHSQPFIFNAPTLWPLPFPHPSTVHHQTSLDSTPHTSCPLPWFIITINNTVIPITINESELRIHILSQLFFIFN